jgi:hypothetical protein
MVLIGIVVLILAVVGLYFYSFSLSPETREIQVEAINGGTLNAPSE